MTRPAARRPEVLELEKCECMRDGARRPHGKQQMMRKKA